MNRWKIPDGLEREIVARDRACVYCGVQFIAGSTDRRFWPSWEHIINDASITTSENIARCCLPCNASKGTKPLPRWLESAYCLKRGISPASIAPVVKEALDRITTERTMMVEVQKIDIAVQELEDALKLYFDGRFYSALILAHAAGELLGRYVEKHGQTSAWHQTRHAVTQIANALRAAGGSKPTTVDDIGDLMNYAPNQSKHAGYKTLTVQFDPQFEASEVIDRAISNFDVLFDLPDYDLPELALAQRFRMESIGRVA